MVALVHYVADRLAPLLAALNLEVHLPFVGLYVGPDQLLPFASALGAIAGVALMFWNKLVALVRRCWTLIARRRRSEPGKPPLEDRA